MRITCNFANAPFALTTAPFLITNWELGSTIHQSLARSRYQHDLQASGPGGMSYSMNGNGAPPNTAIAPPNSTAISLPYDPSSFYARSQRQVTGDWLWNLPGQVLFTDKTAINTFKYVIIISGTVIFIIDKGPLAQRPDERQPGRVL